MLTVVASSFERYLANINLENDIAQPEATRSEKRLAVASLTQLVFNNKLFRCKYIMKLLVNCTHRRNVFFYRDALSAVFCFSSINNFYAIEKARY